MPPTPGAEWAVAHFRLDDMYNNDRHAKILAPDQQYEKLYIKLNGELKADAFLEIDWVVIWKGDDNEAPTAPGAMQVKTEGDRTKVSWAASIDNLRVSHYEILEKAKDEWSVVTAAMSNWAVLPKDSLKAGEYAVRAVDVAGNRSPEGPAITQ
ncbi:hypothetical protein ACFL4W_05680 [Planctomycetota bacterium]